VNQLFCISIGLGKVLFNISEAINTTKKNFFIDFFDEFLLSKKFIKWKTKIKNINTTPRSIRSRKPTKISKLSKNKIDPIKKSKITTQYHSKNVFEIVTKRSEIKRIKDWAKKTSLNIIYYLIKENEIRVVS
jgi:hypothetical protein